MNILFLGSPDNPLIPYLKKDFQVFDTVQPVSPQSIDNMNIGFVVSYGYRHILKKEFLDKLPGKMINCHIGYLPFNRGADPNFWSYMESTPSGVTCHLIDEGIDTGPVFFRDLCQKTYESTLRTTYGILQMNMVHEFKKHWPKIFSGEMKPIPQSELEGGVPGTFHFSKDKFKWIEGIKDKYLDMPIHEVENYVAETMMSQQDAWMVREQMLRDLAQTAGEHYAALHEAHLKYGRNYFSKSYSNIKTTPSREQPGV